MTGPRDHVSTLAARGDVVVDDVLDPADVLDPLFPELPAPQQAPGIQVARWQMWRAAWLAARDRLADQELEKLNRWDPEAAMCA